MIDKINNIFVNFYTKKTEEKLTNLKTSSFGVFIASAFVLFPILLIYGSFIDNNFFLALLISVMTSCVFGFLIERLILKPFFKYKNRQLLKLIKEGGLNKLNIIENFHKEKVEKNGILLMYTQEAGLKIEELKNTLMSKEEIEYATKLIINEVGESTFRKEIENKETLNLIKEKGGITYDYILNFHSKIKKESEDKNKDTKIKSIIDDLILSTRKKDVMKEEKDQVVIK